MTESARDMGGRLIATYPEVEWGTFTVTTKGIDRVYPAARTARGIMRSPREDGSGKWIAARRGTFKSKGN